jgi:hypothetical protein
MARRWRYLLCAVFLTGAGLSVAHAASTQCVASSGKQSVALLELYTSEGCSSCPPADKWLSDLPAAGLSAERVVPIALHVDYWNYLGWPDPFSQPQFSQRQRHMGAINHLPTIYTPQVLLNGRDLRSWYQWSHVTEEIGRVNATPARADIRLALRYTAAERLQIRTSVKVPGGGGMSAHAQLFLVVYENGLRRKITAGENTGRTLHHNFVARAFVGPLSIGQGEVTRSIDLGSDWKREELGVVAFVQDRRNADVLQALAMPACNPA